MRLFIAIEIPEEVKDYIGKIQENIGNKGKIRLVNKGQIHLTLKFLGEVQPDKTEKVKEELKKIKFKPFSVYLDSVGVFPSESYIRVVWIGLKPENGILELQSSIDEKLKGLFEKEKDFKAHVTLARVKLIDDKKRFIEQLKKIKVEHKKFDIGSFKLVKSTLSPKGAVYEEMGIFGK